MEALSGDRNAGDALEPGLSEQAAKSRRVSWFLATGKPPEEDQMASRGAAAMPLPTSSLSSPSSRCSHPMARWHHGTSQSTTAAGQESFAAVGTLRGLSH